MGNTLDYSSAPVVPIFRPGVGYVSLLIVNIASIALSVWVLRSNIIGDAYGPMVGMFYGVPFTLVQLMGGTGPSYLHWSRYRHSARPIWILPLYLAGWMAFAMSAGVTAACICMPRTHGSGC